jgi:hypothetical protein
MEVFMQTSQPRPLFRTVLAAVIFLLTTVAACGEAPPTKPTEKAVTEIVPIAPAGEASFTFLNGTTQDICALAVGFASSGEWNENILEGTLSPGAQFRLENPESMTVDMLAMDCTGATVDASFGVPIGQGEGVWDIQGFDIPDYEAPAPPLTSPGQVWLVMLYADADDELLESSIFLDLNEAELVGSSDRVQIVAQMDRFDGGFSGDGDWTGAKRFFVTPDDDPLSLGSQEVMDLGEVNMADPDTLADFIIWAVKEYPADRRILILSDHGSGWPGGWSDATAPGDLLTTPDIEKALSRAKSETGMDRLDILGFDACLMGSLEVETAVAPYARYAVASEEVEPAIGWAYAGFLDALTKNPGMNSAELARVIVDQYIDGDPVAQQAGKDFLQSRKADSTLSAVDLAVIPDLLDALDGLLVDASGVDQSKIALARYFSQSYTSIFGRGVPPSFLDLGHLVRMLAATRLDEDLIRDAARLESILDQAVIAEKHGPQRSGSTGISLYFPNSKLYASPDLGSDSRKYTSMAASFARESLWDDFLLFHYTGAVMPQAGSGGVSFAAPSAVVSGPGVGQINIGEISASADVFSMDRPVNLSVEISGGNVAQVLLFWGLYDEVEDSILALETAFLPAEVDREINGVVFPDWSRQTVQGVLTLGGNLWPQNLVVSDGTDFATGVFIPEQYGGGGIYQVYGTFTSSSTGERRPAMLRFNLETAKMLNLVIFTAQGSTLIPREYTPQTGDRFTMDMVWTNLSTSEVTHREGDTLVFGEDPFVLDTVPADPGKYVIGLTVLDLDGNAFRRQKWMTVEAVK